MADTVTLTADQIGSPHVLRTALADGQQLVVLSGVLVATLKGGDGVEWAKRTVRASLPLGVTFSAAQWAPSVSIAAADVDAAADNPGWAVDGFALVDPQTAGDQVTLEVQTAVRHPSSFLLRLTYQITLVGTAS